MSEVQEQAESVQVVVSPSQIQYTILTPHSSYLGNLFFYQTYNLLRECPKDLLQIADAFNYFSFCLRLGVRKSINLFALPDQIFSVPAETASRTFFEYSGMFNKDLVKVFFIDPAAENHRGIANFLRRTKFSYFYLGGEIAPEIQNFYDMSKHFRDGHELVALIESDLTDINREISKEYDHTIDDFYFGSGDTTDKLNPPYATMVAETNYFTLNQILSNFWKIRHGGPKKEDVHFFSNEKVDFQLKQIKQIDALHAKRSEVPPITPIEPITPAMIIIAPFHFPKYGKIRSSEIKTRRDKGLFRISQSEQNLDYSFEIDPALAESFTQYEIAQVLGLLTQRLLSLDQLAYLHAQFQYSPVFRLPIVGKSLNTDLSHFQQSFSTKAEAIRKIGVIGALMKSKLIDERFAECLRHRGGQLVVISDLPIEWLKLNEYPLCLTHDICRIPEYNTNSLINNFVQNQRLSFKIRPDILTRTLIIHCASERDVSMQAIFKEIDEYQVRYGFKTAICKTVLEIKEAVDRHRPDFIIFDCHGGFDKATLASFLVVDGRNKILLTGEDIIKYKISAPLIFISACSTMPNYGYVKFISDAFFQAGAFAVTATYLPIKMGDAATLIVRILNNLKQHQDKVIHFNWLAFLSHTLRGVIVFETVRKARKSILQDIDRQKIGEMLTELMVFDRRADVFDKLKDYLKTMEPAANIAFEDLEHEWLSYTTVGRADLILFENWLEGHQRANFGEPV